MIALYIILGILVLFIIPHFLLIYIVFNEFFGRMTNKVIDKRVCKNHNYDARRDEMFALMEKQKTDYEEVETMSFDGLKLHGYYFDKVYDKIVIMFHGVHANSLFHYSIHVREFLKRGYNALVIDQRAHGKSEGKYITYGVKEQEDVLSWVDFVEQTYQAKEIYLYGMSMGATSICLAAPRITNPKVKAVVIDSAFISIKELVNHIVSRGGIPKPLFYDGIKFLAKHWAGITFDSFDTRESLKENKIPAMFVQGTNDIVVSKQFLIDNYNNCSSSKDILEVEGASHTLALPLASEEELEKIFKFLRG